MSRNPLSSGNSGAPALKTVEQNKKSTQMKGNVFEENVHDGYEGAKTIHTKVKDKDGKVIKEV